MRVTVQCDVCGREASAVRVQGRNDIPPNWVALSAECCPHVEYFACDNPICRKRVAHRLLSEHESPTLRLRQTVQVPIAGAVNFLPLELNLGGE